MSLIDDNALITKVCNTMYCDGRDEDIFLDMIRSAPKIDPIHATGHCYCYECRYHEKEVYSDGEWEVHDNEECWCNWWDSTMPLNGFCSEGRKE